MRVLAGTVGFSYKAWKGRFYPADTPDHELLGYYSERLPAVELNNTFYRIPRRTTCEKWHQRSAPDFFFCAKASKHVTHVRPLADTPEPLGYMMRSFERLEDKLAAVLFQVPPYFKKDLRRLRVFLNRLPRDLRVTVEFRNSSWFDDEVYEELEARNVALAVNDIDDTRRASPFVATADWGYLRMLRRRYDEAALDEWAGRIRDQSWTRAFVFFDTKGAAPELALALNDRFAEADAASTP